MTGKVGHKKTTYQSPRFIRTYWSNQPSMGIVIMSGQRTLGLLLGCPIPLVLVGMA